MVGASRRVGYLQSKSSPVIISPMEEPKKSTAPRNFIPLEEPPPTIEQASGVPCETNGSNCAIGWLLEFTSTALRSQALNRSQGAMWLFQQEWRGGRTEAHGRLQQGTVYWTC